MYFRVPVLPSNFVFVTFSKRRRHTFSTGSQDSYQKRNWIWKETCKCADEYTAYKTLSVPDYADWQFQNLSPFSHIILENKQPPTYHYLYRQQQSRDWHWQWRRCSVAIMSSWKIHAYFPKKSTEIHKKITSVKLMCCIILLLSNCKQ